jgi:DNA-binding transcriptional regulator LsrR (DeoR family)
MSSERVASSPDTAAGPAAAVLAATIARRFYFDGATKGEIAAELGLSRFKVARILERARSTGLVRIELHYEGELDLELSLRLGRHLGLRRCLVVDSGDHWAPWPAQSLAPSAVGVAPLGFVRRSGWVS